MRAAANSTIPACPDCGSFYTEVVQVKRIDDESQLTIRRRKCNSCFHRFYTTQEQSPPEIPVQPGRVRYMKQGNEQKIYLQKSISTQDPKLK